MYPQHSHRSMEFWAAGFSKDIEQLCGLQLRFGRRNQETEWFETDARLPSIIKYKFTYR
jgi:hypothetical protein